MTYVALSPPDVTQPGGEKQDDHGGLRIAGRGLRWWLGAIALGTLALWIFSALFFAWLRWGKFDAVEGSSQARQSVGIQISPAEHPWYYPWLLFHVITATVALGTVVLQLWPGLRARHPRVHRTVGRIYIFGGVYPAVISALVVEAFWPFSVVTAVSQVVLALLWGFVTTVGLVLRRQGRTEDHRRFMIRSFALTVTVLLEIAIHPYVEALMRTQLDTRLAGSKDILTIVTASTENWLCLIILILVVEGYFERDRLRRSALPQPTADTLVSTVSAR